MVKPLTFKGDERTKKRKAPSFEEREPGENNIPDPNLEAQVDDTWVTAESSVDINGPVIIVLPSAKPACVACDADGKVFVSELQNMVEGNPASAEPHDIRQVWVVTKIVGTEDIGFKSHHKRYLSCDSLGIFSARTEAMSTEETFTCTLSPGHLTTFNIKSQGERFLAMSDDGKDICGDTNTATVNASVYIRMQACFKPKLKASKELKDKGRISRKELEKAVGRKLEEGQVRKLKKARKEGDYHEAILDLRQKGKHDKYS
ncbi:MAG: hypothetical protein Q9219_007671 [cf. Caloplaca sp. 3 TL-2023]